MNYYERHIGDYLKDTAHLSLLEHGIYGRLLDVYYTREGAIPVAQVERLIGVRSKDERVALGDVLDEFFTVEADALQNSRCEREIARYQKKASHNRVVGKLGGRPRKTETQAVTKQEPTNNPGGFKTEPTNNPPQYPVPSNQYPVTRKKTEIPTPPDGVAPEVWADWLKIRKAKRLPWTDTAWQEIQKQIAASGLTIADGVRECCARGWGSFRADWYANQPSAKPPPETAYQATMRGKWETLTGRNRPKGEIIDVAPIAMD